MISDSSALWVDLKQQRTLKAAQANRLNVTLIWRLNWIFLEFVNLKDFEGFCREGGLRRKKDNLRGRLEKYRGCRQTGCGWQFIRDLKNQGIAMAVSPRPVMATMRLYERLSMPMYRRISNQ